MSSIYGFLIFRCFCQHNLTILFIGPLGGNLILVRKIDWNSKITVTLDNYRNIPQKPKLVRHLKRGNGVRPDK